MTQSQLWSAPLQKNGNRILIMKRTRTRIRGSWFNEIVFTVLWILQSQARIPGTHSRCWEYCLLTQMSPSLGLSLAEESLCLIPGDSLCSVTCLCIRSRSLALTWGILYGPFQLQSFPWDWLKPFLHLLLPQSFSPFSLQVMVSRTLPRKSFVHTSPHRSLFWGWGGWLTICGYRTQVALSHEQIWLTFLPRSPGVFFCHTTLVLISTEKFYVQSFST